MSGNGWIKLHRCLLDSSVFCNEKLLKVWVWCLLKASHKTKELMIGMQDVQINEGQFIFGRAAASKDLKMPQSTVWDCMKKLESKGNIVINSNNKFSVVTVENWATYQLDEDDFRQHLDNSSTTVRQHSDTNKKDKNIKNIYICVPDAIKEPFMAWVDMRKKIKKPITSERAVTTALNKLNKLTTDTSKQIELIDIATSNCWLSFYEPKDYSKPSYQKEEVKPKRYKEFAPDPKVDAVEMPDEIRNRLKGIF